MRKKKVGHDGYRTDDLMIISQRPYPSDHAQHWLIQVYYAAILTDTTHRNSHLYVGGLGVVIIIIIIIIGRAIEGISPILPPRIL